VLLLTTIDIPGPALISSTSEHSTARGPTPTTSPPPSQPQPSKPDYSAFSAFGSAAPAPKSATPQPSLFQQQQAATAAKAQPPAPPSDPFAALTSPIRQSTPQQAQPSMFDFGNHQAPAPVAAAAPAADDDEWAFASALPEGLPSSNTIAVSNTNLGISLHATREPQTPAIITLSLTFSNATAQPISELTFMAAVTKVGIHTS
jgi:ADP-ribosylation factor-binding protein GGA